MVESEHFHVGIVVPDLEAARAQLGELLGVTWGPIVERDGDFVDASGEEVSHHLRLCYSTVAPYLELIEEVPGSVWVCNAHSNLHHLGFGSDAVAADSTRWSATGCPMAIGSRNNGAIWTAYHDVPIGVRLELVANAAKTMIEQTMCVPESGS